MTVPEVKIMTGYPRGGGDEPHGARRAGFDSYFAQCSHWKRKRCFFHAPQGHRNFDEDPYSERVKIPWRYENVSSRAHVPCRWVCDYVARKGCLRGDDVLVEVT